MESCLSTGTLTPARKLSRAAAYLYGGVCAASYTRARTATKRQWSVRWTWPQPNFESRDILRCRRKTSGVNHALRWLPCGMGVLSLKPGMTDLLTIGGNG